METEVRSGKKAKASDYEIFWLCIRYYARETVAAPHILLFVFVSIAIRGILYTMVSDIVFELENCGNLLGAVTKIFLYRMGIIAIEGVTSIIFENSMGEFQAKASVRAVVNILNNEVAGKFDMTSGKSQYFISKGIEGLSKVIKTIFIDVVGRFLYIQIDLYRIYSKYGASYLVIGLALLVIGLFIHIRGTFVILGCKRRLNTARTQMDKKIYEILLNYETIKAYRTEEKEALSFKEKVDPWERAYIFMKKAFAVLGTAHNLLFRIAAFIIVLILCKCSSNADGNRVRNMYSLISDYDKSVEDVSTIYGKLRGAILNSTMVLQYLNNGFKGSECCINIDYFHEKLEFKDVTFASRGTTILRKLNFVVNKGDKIAIYGRNGAGKSTIFKLILRLLKPIDGSITIDGIQISNTNIKNYRSLITYIPQQADLFDDTIYNNLRYGNERCYSEIIEECKRLNIHDEILKLSAGYNTVVGERGGYVSGGLRQKIYCVRALLKDAFIYLFDEPTSNFDESSVDVLIDMILNPKFSNKTFLVICHSLEIIKRFPKTLHFT